MTLFDDSVADIIRQYLIDEALGVEGTTAVWSVFTGLMPTSPDQAICCYNTQGRFDGRLMRTGEKIEHPGIQVLVRGFDYASTEKKARAIALNFDGQRDSEVQIESNRFYRLQNISRTSPILPMGILEDDRRRYHFAINAVLTLTEYQL